MHCNAQCSQLHSHNTQSVAPLHIAITASRNPRQTSVTHSVASCLHVKRSQPVKCHAAMNSVTFCLHVKRSQPVKSHAATHSVTFCLHLNTSQPVQCQCSKSRDAALAGMAVKVMQLESLVSSKQAELQRMGDTGQAWIEEACCLRDAVASTLAALGQPPSLLCHVPHLPLRGMGYSGRYSRIAGIANLRTWCFFRVVGGQRTGSERKHPCFHSSVMLTSFLSLT